MMMVDDPPYVSESISLTSNEKPEKVQAVPEVTEPQFIVRSLPAWEELEPPEGDDVAPFVREYCYDAADADSWVSPPDVDRGPILTLAVKGHEEIQGHTWYRIICTLTVRLESHIGSIGWQVPRRLAQLREDLHMPIKTMLGNSYRKYFGDAPFARSLGLPGTTDRLRAWCGALASCISSGGASPAIVARVIYFLDTPEPECFLTETDPVDAATGPVVLDAPTNRISEAVQVGDSTAIVTADVGIDASKALMAKPFKDWIDRISTEKRIEVSQIHIQSIDMFGPNKVGFIKFKTDAKVHGKPVPGIVFMRGGAVAILVILEHGDRQFTLLVRQPRVPVCSGSLAEIPAGMLDGDGNFSGVAAKEMKEETGIEIKEDDLIDMTHLAFGDKFPGMFPSCGGSDEFNRIFLYRKHVDAQELQGLQGKLTGVIEEGEMIKLQIIPLQELWRTSPDAKALAALCLYKNLDDSARLPKDEDDYDVIEEGEEEEFFEEDEEEEQDDEDKEV